MNNIPLVKIFTFFYKFRLWKLQEVTSEDELKKKIFLSSTESSVCDWLTKSSVFAILAVVTSNNIIDGDLVNKMSLTQIYDVLTFSFFNVPPTPSGAPVSWPGSQKCHEKNVVLGNESFISRHIMWNMNLFLYWLTGLSLIIIILWMFKFWFLSYSKTSTKCATPV